MFRSTLEGDELQMNMETISKELNDLMVAEEEYRLVSQVKQFNGIVKSTQNIPTEGNVSTLTNLGYPQRESIVIADIKGQTINNNGAGNGTTANHAPNLSYHQSLQGHNAMYPIYQNTAAYPFIYTAGGYVSENYPNRSTVQPLHLANQNDGMPKCEFHYLRPQIQAGKVTTASLLSATAKDDHGGSNGYYRRINKSHIRANMRGATGGGHDYDKIVVDLSTLGILLDGKESNPVLRLFGCLRDLHNAIAEVPPSFESAPESAFEATFAPTPKAVMPCTMNVQYQVKHASRKLYGFFLSLQQAVANNRVYEQNLSGECDRCLYKLQALMTQFEMYKRVELEHKRGQFVTEDIRVHAERLEVLLGKLSQQVRETHLRVIACDWFIGIKYRGQRGRKFGSAAIQQDNDIGGKMKTHSKIGVINEILQLCNTISSSSSAVTSENNKNLTKTASPTYATQSAEKMTDNNLQQMTTVVATTNNAQEAAAAATLATSATTTKFGSLLKSSLNSRQPVFYIG